MRSPTPGRWTTSAISPTFSPESQVRTAPSSARDAASVDCGAAAPTVLERYRAQLGERALEEDAAQLAVVERLDALRRRLIEAPQGGTALLARALQAPGEQIHQEGLAATHAAPEVQSAHRRGSRQDLPDGSVLREPAVRAGAAGTFPPLHARGARAAEEHPRSALPARRGRAGAVARRAVAVPR